MTTQSPWFRSGSIRPYPKVENNIKVDVAIIGGGITGVTAAYLLKKAGYTVALIERDRFASHDTGHTTAHLTHVTDSRLQRLIKEFGRTQAENVWNAGRTAIDLIAQNIDRETIQCDFSRVPGFLFQSLKETPSTEIEELKKEAQASQNLGFDADYADIIPVFRRPGICYPNQAEFHPLKYIYALLSQISGNGNHAFENSEVEEISKIEPRLKVNGHYIEAGYFIVATHMPIIGRSNILKATLLQTKLMAYTSYAIGMKIPKGIYPAACFWDTSDPYYYLRISRGQEFDYAIFGGEDHKTGQARGNANIFQNLHDIIKPYIPDGQVDAQWSGQVIMTSDGLPYIGEIAPKQFVATGFNGNGITFGTLSGLMACNAVLGIESPWTSVFDIHRKTLSATWNTVKQNSDFPYYLIKDRLKNSESKSIEDLKAGDGRILDIDGQRLAVYKTASNEVIKLSGICTHLGCVVHWNQVESTWDCPCHGSRFKPTGEVIAGPAEAPLPKFKESKDKIRKLRHR